MSTSVKSKWCRAVVRTAVGLFFLVVGIWLFPQRWCGRESGAWYKGNAELQQELALGVVEWTTTDLAREDFHTGDSRFNGEWFFGTYMMAGMGFGQTILEHPERRLAHLGLMEACIRRLLSPEVRAFDREAWGNDPIDTLADDTCDHGGYLGYFNLLLSFYRRIHSTVTPTYAHDKLNDRITAALVRRLQKSPTLLICTYPNQAYPVDNCAVIASIRQYDLATGADHSELIRRWTERCRQAYVDGKTGLLYQSVHATTGVPTDAPRGSGTCLGLYFLSFADISLSRELYSAVRKELGRTVCGFGAVREYPLSLDNGHGDLNSGPIAFGYGLSATGLCLGASRIHRDQAYFARLYATAHLFGAPSERDGRRHFISAGPFGDAVMLAMLTARRASVSAWEEP